MMGLRRHLRRLTGAPDPFASEPALEVIYRDLFRSALQKIGEEDDFVPVGGAANYSLLYLILRLASELRPHKVLDIGAGQSSLLWAKLRRAGLVSHVVTLESNQQWASRIGAQVDHEMVVTPLSTQRIAGRPTDTYDWDAARAHGPFDLIVCDGPNGTKRHSRRGILSIVDDHLPEDFVLVLDDAERRGEQDTITAIHDRLQAMQRRYELGIVRAAKTQAFFAGGAYLPAIYL